MPAYFCTQTGIRIVAPGVHASVDPDNGHDACLEVDGEIVVIDGAAAATSDKPAKGNKPKKTEDDGAESSAAAATSDKPAKGNK